VEKGFGIGDANIFDLQNVFKPAKKFASDVIADVKENKADLLPYMGIGATTDIAGFPADMYSLYGQLRKGVGSPTLASILGPEIEKIAGSEALLENISLPALKQMGIEPKRGTYTENVGRILGLPGAGLAVKAGTDITKGLGEVALKALKPDEIAMTSEGFAMPVPKDSSVLEMSGKTSGSGQYSDELTKQIEGLADTNPDIYKSAKAMVKGNNPEDRIKKMIESRLAPKQKILTGTAEQDLNFVSPENIFPQDPKLYLDPSITGRETASLLRSRTSYNDQPYSLEARNKFVRERPIHFNSVFLARQAILDTADGRLTGKEIHKKIKNSQLKDGGVKDKELKDTGLDELKDSDDVFELSSDQKTLINLTNPQKIDSISSALISPKIAAAAQKDISLTQNQIVSRSNFVSDYGTPDPKDFDEIPFTDREPFYVGESYPRMFEENQRIGGVDLAIQESTDYGIVSINDPKSDFRAHISGDAPPEIAKGNIAWSRVSVREHPNGKKYLVPEEFQSDLHTRAQGTASTRPGRGYKVSQDKIDELQLDYDNKFSVHFQEKRNLKQEVQESSAMLPSTDYSVMGKNANDIINLKSLHENAVIQSLGDPSFVEFNNITSNPISRVAPREGLINRPNERFNKFSENFANKKIGDTITHPALQKYVEEKRKLAEKYFEKKFGISPNENTALVISKLKDYFEKKNIKSVLDPQYELDNIETALELSMKDAVNTNDYGFSNVSAFHGNIMDLNDLIDDMPDVKRSIYLNSWKTLNDLKKDPAEYKNMLDLDKNRRNYGDDSLAKKYIKDKFLENADPTGELELESIFELNNSEREFQVILDDIEYALDPERELFVEDNVDFLSSIGFKDNLKDVFELDGDFNVLEKFFDSKDKVDEALEKLTTAETSSDLPYSPLPQQSEWTKVLMRDLIRTAADKGLDGVVLPNAQAYRYAGGRSDSLIKGYKQTTIPTFKSVAKEINADVDTIEWKGWTSGGQGEASLTELADNNHLVIPVNKNLSKTSIRGYKEGGRVGSLANVNVLDLGESLNG
jgi:hypothetical protein